MKRKNRWLCLLLTLVMLLSLVQSVIVTVHADYSDGDECWNCGHYHWDEYMHECGACSPSCTNDWCALETHCHRCGGCLNGDYPCDECGLCKECMAEIGHCSQCDMCWMDYGGDDVLCGNCRRCEFCSPICPECGMCEECAGDSSDGMHCPECGNCYQVTEQCMFVENNHCKECCEPCEQCGECIAGDHLETCPDCGLCVQCCEFNSMMAGCESGEICVASTDWDDCICEGCGQFFENESDLCGTCLDAGVIRCPSCCELASECSEKMCEYDDEYEDHFCIDCGSCFHDVTLCDTCAGAGELRCEDCCENLTNSLGCDGSCGDVWCSNDTYFEQHLDEEHADRPDFDEHDSFPSNRWSHDKNSHWRECRLCDEDENEELWASHRTDLAAHSYDSNGVCTVCGYSVGNKLYISRQPKDARCITSIEGTYKEDPANGLLWIEHNSVTFSVSVKGGTGSYTYQWYENYKGRITKLDDEMRFGKFSGANTATLAVLVSPEACSENGDYLYYCVITDGKTTVTTEKATIKASHAYSNKYAENTESATPKNAAYKAVSLTYLSSKGETVTVTAPASEGHRHQCLCDDAGLIRHYKTTRSVMHTFGEATLLGRSAKAGATDYDKVYQKTCTACGYKTYYESHKHVYHTEESDFERYNRGSFQVDEEKTTNMAHALVCLVDGCGHIKMESHEWDWRHMGYGSDAEGGGTFYRECRICGYPDYDYRPVDEDGNKINWTTKNVLVTAKNAQVSRTLAVEGDRLTLTINDNQYTQGKRCTGWTVEYIDPDGRLYDITSYYNIVLKEGSEWNTTIKLAGCKTGGYLIFTPTMVECTDHEYVNEGYVAPVCMYNGFAGYRICQYCHTPDPTDTRSDEERVIAAADTKHTGNQLKLYEKEVVSPTGKKTISWTTNKSESNGKRYNYVAGDCTTKGCEGDFLCSACQRVIPGKREYIHSDELDWIGEILPTCGRDGYQGDGHCRNCGKFIRKGYVTEMGKNHAGPIFYDYDHNEKDPTCTTAGKTSAQYCYTCMEMVAEGLIIPPLGHNWVKDEANSTKETTAYKCARSGCPAIKFVAIVTTHAIDVDGGTAYVGGKAVKKANEGKNVTLKAAAIPDGKRFKEWEVVSGGVVITNATDPNNATFVMGSKDVVINAVLETIPVHSVTIVNGSASIGAGSTIDEAQEEAVITITADPAPAGQVFDKWEVISGGVTVTDVTKASTTFTMKNEDVKLKAIYKDAETPHTHTLVKVNAKAATCTDDGNKKYYKCSDCDKLFEDKDATVEITDAKSVVISSLGHDWADATCTAPKTCKREGCGATEGTALGHSYSTEWLSDTTEHWHECDVCHEKSDRSAHRPDREAPTATDHVKCLDCGYVIELAIDHTHSLDKVKATPATCTEDGNIEYYKCSDCGRIFKDADANTEIADLTAVVTKATGHDYEWRIDKEATETEAGSKHEECKNCGDKKEAVVIPKLDKPTDPTKPTGPVDPTKPTDPAKPTKPTDPAKPTKPTDPAKPTKPTDPAKPTKPTDPAKPTKPTDPAKPTKPTDPAKPTEPTKNVNPTQDNPKTDSNSNILLWISLLVVSGTGIFTANKISRNKRKIK